MTDLSTLRSDLTEAEKKIGDVLNELQAKYRCEVSVSVDSVRTVGDPQHFSIVRLEARVGDR